MSGKMAFQKGKLISTPGFCLGLLIFMFSSLTIFSQAQQKQKAKEMTAREILGNPDYLAISFGGFRDTSREIEPTMAELTEDLRILSAMGIKLLRTYNVYYDEAANLLEAITQLKAENPDFEMYLMLGAWIDCKHPRSNHPHHHEESEQNASEIERAIALANKYPSIVKMLAVGNEAMVKWATSYYVEPYIILNWVNHLQALKKKGELPADLWITSSDNFASWGGGGTEYHTDTLNQLIKAVDFISMHTYPMHDTHYNPKFWAVPESEYQLSDLEKIDAAMLRSKQYAMVQYESVVNYMKSLGVTKPVHIGETGWATHSNEHYGDEGSRANDEYKSGIYYKHMREWTNKAGISCFFFEAFDEPWKDAKNPKGSENHFGLINIRSEAKFMIWDEVDKGTFSGLTRGGKPITKTFDGNLDSLLKYVKAPVAAHEIKIHH
jgi:exo-beta-1,3-glucanase (GH17 family)